MKACMILFFLFFGLHAQELNSVLCLEKAKLEAQKQNKNIMVLIIQDNCQYCKRMKETTFKDPEIIKRIKEKYIFIEINRYKDIYPKNYLTVYGVPTTYFLYKNGSKIMRGAGGYWNKEDFLSFMDDADYKIKKKLNNKQ